MNSEHIREWSPEDYEKFHSLRLRPAFDLLSRVPQIPAGPVVDLGCGTGALGPSLKRRFPKASLTGIDTDRDVLRKARYTGVYDRVQEADALDWRPDEPPALIYANGLLQDLPEHDILLRRMASFLRPGGTLAVQMPRQEDAASHAMLRVTAEALFPDRFDFSDRIAPVQPPAQYQRMLDPLGRVSVWETEYLHKLAPTKLGHPVARLAEEAEMAPMLALLSETERVQFTVTYDAAMQDAYPPASDGSVLMAVRRLFLVLTV